MTRQPLLTAQELTAYLNEVFPNAAHLAVIESVGPMVARLRMGVSERHLRPGGTVSGPTMFTLADTAFYVATMAMIGREALTVTTSLTINFLSKPPAADLIAEARILKLGRLLSVGDVSIWSVGRSDGPVAHASVTYAIPPRRSA
ncbi:MAG: hypothetical protein ACI8S6_004787 [Myxococcota bacterium]|jgi:uncharacterized protein (TIGR00369 family)